jgi:predicted transcriptional regulator
MSEEPRRLTAEEREQRTAYVRKLYRRGSSQQQIARELGVAQSTISRMLGGMNPAGRHRVRDLPAVLRNIERRTGRSPELMRMDYAAHVAVLEREARWVEKNAQEAFKAFGGRQWEQKVMGSVRRTAGHLEALANVEQVE